MTEAEAVTEVAYATLGSAAEAFQGSRICTLSMTDLVGRLRAAIEAADLWILHEVDPQMLLRRGGYAIGAALQILFFHPRLMVRLLAADPAALIEVPLKFALLALPDGNIAIRWIDPVAAFGRYANPALAKLGEELAKTFHDIVTASLGDNKTGAPL